jgi:hypothetical protein
MKEYLGALKNWINEKRQEFSDKRIIRNYENGPKGYLHYPSTCGFFVPPEVYEARERIVDRELSRNGY